MTTKTQEKQYYTFEFIDEQSEKLNLDIATRIFDKLKEEPYKSTKSIKVPFLSFAPMHEAFRNFMKFNASNYHFIEAYCDFEDIKFIRKYVDPCFGESATMLTLAKSIEQVQYIITEMIFREKPKDMIEYITELLDQWKPHREIMKWIVETLKNRYFGYDIGEILNVIARRMFSHSIYLEDVKWLHSIDHLWSKLFNFRFQVLESAIWQNWTNVIEQLEETQYKITMSELRYLAEHYKFDKVFEIAPKFYPSDEWATKERALAFLRSEMITPMM